MRSGDVEQAELDVADGPEGARDDNRDCCNQEVARRRQWFNRASADQPGNA